jgi:hypothetical protein
MGQLLREGLKWVCLLLAITLISLVALAQVGEKGFLLVDDTPTRASHSSYMPPTYGIPETITGYRVLTVRTPENTACMLPGSRRVVLQASAPDVDRFLQDTDIAAVQAELATLSTEVRWEISFVGPSVTFEQILSETEKWNAQFSDGCVRLGPAEAAVHLTP